MSLFGHCPVDERVRYLNLLHGCSPRHFGLGVMFVSPDRSDMAVLQSLQRGAGAVRRNPLIVGVVFAALLLQAPVQFAQQLSPSAAVAVSAAVSIASLLVVPFVYSGLLGMAEEALDGSTTFGTFVTAGKRHYTSMLGAYLLLLVGSLAVGFALSILSFGVGVAAISSVFDGGNLGQSPVAVGAIALVGVASMVALFVPLFFLQFYGQAIVLDGRGVVGGFKRSVGLVRRNLVSVFGYSVLVFAVGLVAGLVSSVPSILLTAATAESVGSAAASPEFLLWTGGTLLVVDAVTSVAGGLFLTFSVAFYRSMQRPGDADGTQETRDSSVV
jgi:hypothetical protein